MEVTSNLCNFFLMARFSEVLKICITDSPNIYIINGATHVKTWHAGLDNNKNKALPFYLLLFRPYIFFVSPRIHTDQSLQVSCCNICNANQAAYSTLDSISWSDLWCFFSSKVYRMNKMWNSTLSVVIWYCLVNSGAFMQHLSIFTAKYSGFVPNIPYHLPFPCQK